MEKSREYWTNEKTRQMKRYGAVDLRDRYELDHLVPLELGGSNDPDNLWPEPDASPNRKDAVENAARRAVCSSRMLLEHAQTQMASDWRVLEQELGE